MLLDLSSILLPLARNSRKIFEFKGVIGKILSANELYDVASIFPEAIYQWLAIPKTRSREIVVGGKKNWGVSSEMGMGARLAHGGFVYFAP
jgi:hypothetical protein